MLTLYPENNSFILNTPHGGVIPGKALKPGFYNNL